MLKKEHKNLAPLKSSKGLSVYYTKELNKLGKQLIKAVRVDVLAYLKANQKSYVIDGVGSQLGSIFDQLNKTFTGTIMAAFSQSVATDIVSKTAKASKRKFDRVVSKAVGVDLSNIIAVEGLQDFIDLSVNQNARLITSLPGEYLKQVEVIVNNGVMSGAKYSTIEKEITASVGGANRKLANRIKTIARDQTSTLMAQINLRRSNALGITRGIWRTSEDERVRGNPSGKYPNSKPSHFKANGEEFDLSKGLKVDGEYIIPGIPINCRCSYSPIINIDEAGSIEKR